MKSARRDGSPGLIAGGCEAVPPGPSRYRASSRLAPVGTVPTRPAVGLGVPGRAGAGLAVGHQVQSPLGICPSGVGWLAGRGVLSSSPSPVCSSREAFAASVLPAHVGGSGGGVALGWPGTVACLVPSLLPLGEAASNYLTVSNFALCLLRVKQAEKFNYKAVIPSARL